MSWESELWGERLDLIGALAIAVSVIGSLVMFSHWLGKRMSDLAHTIREIATEHNMSLEHFIDKNEDSHGNIRKDILQVGDGIEKIGDHLDSCDTKLTDSQERIARVETKVDAICK